MFEIGWTEMLVIAIVMIVVVGPKDLPRMLRTFGKMTSKMTSMAGDFRKQFDEALKEAELDDVKKTIDSARRLNPTAEIKRALNPMEQAAKDVRSGLDQMMKPKPPVLPTQGDAPKPDEAAKPAEPAKVDAAKVEAKPQPKPATKKSAPKPAAPKAAAPKAAAPRNAAKPAKAAT